MVCVCDANNMRLGGPASVVEQRERERQGRRTRKRGYERQFLKRRVTNESGQSAVATPRRGVVVWRGRGLDPPRPTALAPARPGRNNTHATQHIDLSY